MLSGVALAVGEVEDVLAASHALGRRVHDRGSEKEYRFLARDAERLLPVWLNGQMHVLRWGSRRERSRVLPPTGWTKRETVEGSGWDAIGAEEVVIPATMGLERGIWFHVSEGVRGVVARSETGEAVAYVMVEPATHYFRVMTGSEWMPSLVRQLI
jgi:hypothetical protein